MARVYSKLEYNVLLKATTISLQIYNHSFYPNIFVQLSTLHISQCIFLLRPHARSTSSLLSLGRFRNRPGGISFMAQYNWCIDWKFENGPLWNCSLPESTSPTHAKNATSSSIVCSNITFYFFVSINVSLLMCPPVWLVFFLPFPDGVFTFLQSREKQSQTCFPAQCISNLLASQCGAHRGGIQRDIHQTHPNYSYGQEKLMMCYIFEKVKVQGP